MEELFELRTLVEAGKYAEALNLIGEMEEMSRDDKISKIESFLEILLLHLIKQHAENRSTRSWDVSIRNAVRAVIRANKRRKAGGRYLSEGELREAMDEIYPAALDRASLEVFDGLYEGSELVRMVDSDKIKSHALDLVTSRSH